MLINYKLADGRAITVDVSSEVADFLDADEVAQKKIERKETRRHTSIESFTYEDKRYFTDDCDVENEIVYGVTIKSILAILPDHEQFSFMKRVFERWSFAEIANKLNATPQLAHYYYNQALTKVRRAWKN